METVLSEVKQQLSELKKEIRALRRNQTEGEGEKRFVVPFSFFYSVFP